MPPQDEPLGILVVHDKGFGDRSAQELARSPDVTLKPWARIEGTFWIRGEAGVRQRIDVNLNRSVILPGYQVQTYTATTHEQGHFIIERVMDGEASFIWSSGQRALASRSSAGPAADVRPGQTLQVDLGGQGRPLMGQIVLSADQTRLNDPAASVDAHGWMETQPAQMPRPSDFLTWDEKKRQAHSIRWFQTEPGRAYLRTRRYHSFAIGADGRFRIEDVVPGSYTIRISAWSAPGLTHPLTRNRLEGRIERDLEVAPIPGGQSDEPLDLGTIPVKLEIKKEVRN